LGERIAVRRSQRNSSRSTGAKRSAETDFSNQPFKAFAESLKKQLKQEKAAEARRPPPPPPAPPPPPPPPSEEELFRREMAGVQRIAGGAETVPPPREVVVPPPRDDEAEAMAELADLVEGRGVFDFTESDEYIEGIAEGLNRRLLKRLRQGQFAVQAHLDLHGKTRVEARQEVERFLVASRQQGRRCVLIVHGRGLNSKDQIPVLKEGLKVWLAHGRIARSVLAFCTARPSDGGAGAAYVLLRR
jgi:DNA-nicking Smr family endonuclease